MTDLVKFLRARLDDDERVAQEAKPGPWNYDPDPYEDEVYSVHDGDQGDQVGDPVCFTRGFGHQEANGVHIARWDPARVLAEVKAKRAILNLHVELCYGREDGGPELCGGYSEAYWDVIQLMAEPYAAHPHYDPAWSATTASGL